MAEPTGEVPQGNGEAAAKREACPPSPGNGVAPTSRAASPSSPVSGEALARRAVSPSSSFKEPVKSSMRKALEENRKVLADMLVKSGGGSLMRGWRREFDSSGKFAVDFEDYARAAARLRFAVDTELLFGLDGDLSTLTLEELNPHQGRLMDDFKLWIQDTFGGTRQMFRSLDSAGSGRLGASDFATACAASGFEGSREDAQLIFDCCDLLQVGFIQEDDILFLEADPKSRTRLLYQARVCRMDQWRQLAAQEFMHHIERAKKAKARGMNPTKDRRAPRRWLDRTFESLPAVALWSKHERERSFLKKARQARLDFKKHLCEIYGDEVRAMRRSLDPHMQYSFTLKTLRRYCQKHNLHINVWDLWRGLDRDEDGLVRIEELSSEHAFALASLRRWAQVEPELGSCAAIWTSPEAAAVQRDRTGTWYSEKKMQASTFVETLRRLGWPGVDEKSTRRLVVAALDFHGCQVITRADLEWLDKWMPLEWLHADPDPDALEDFKALLVKSYGHPLAAWRKALDADDSNHVTWYEFREACRRFSFPNAAGAWRALDDDCTGSISVLQFDPDSAELLRSFKEWAEVNWGSVKACFKSLDADGDGFVTLAELKRACHKMHWDGDVPLLFDCLDLEGKVVGQQLARSLSFASIAFLDTWHFDMTEQELAAEEAVAAPQRRKRTRAKDIAEITARLTVPIGFPRSLSSPALLAESPATAAAGGEGGGALPSVGGAAAGRKLSSRGGDLGSALGAPQEPRHDDESFSQRVDALLEWERTWG